MKFSIREVLLGTVIAALALGWWLDRSQRPPPPLQPAVDSPLELIVSGKDHDKLLLFDPQTGAMWERQSNAKWSPYTDGLRKSNE
jgi:hypothetical protein